MLPIAAATQITVGQGTGDRDPGLVPVMFASDTQVTAVQIDIAYDSTQLISGSPLPGAVALRHAIGSSEPTNGIRRVVIYSMSNLPLTNGVMLQLPFTRRHRTPDGIFAITPTVAVASQQDGTAARPVTLVPGSYRLQSGGSARFTMLSQTPAGSIQLELSGPVGQIYAIQATADFQTWVSLLTNPIPASGVLRLNDSPSSAIRHRFYRALQR